MDFSQERIIGLICMIPAYVLGLTIHEFAHAWAGWRLGDDTPRRLGRLTLDPMAHLDPFGVLFFIVAAFSGYGIGWAKPVPINPRNMGNPRRDSMLVAIAGPISNLLQVPIWLLALYFFGVASRANHWEINTFGGTDIYSMLATVLMWGVILNISLAAFNMVPLPPLDGHWVLEYFGGPPVTAFYDVIRPYSFMILILLLNFTPIFHILLGPIYSWTYFLVDQAFYGVGR